MSDAPASVHIDGAARGNPGPASFAYVIAPPGARVVEDYGPLGTATNNIAEYTALVKALEKCAALLLEHLHIHSDSELLVKQMNGEYRVKNLELKGLYDEAQRLVPLFKSVRIEHVRREQNKRADELCNRALDGEKPKSPAGTKKKSKGSTVNDAGVRDDCILCLEAARQAWSARDEKAPSPAQLWDQLWSILEEGGVLKKAKAT